MRSFKFCIDLYNEIECYILVHFRLALNEPGIYEICLLNRYDSAPKQVYISLYSESSDRHWPFAYLEDLNERTEEAEQYMEMATKTIRVGWCKAPQILFVLRAKLYICQAHVFTFIHGRCICVNLNSSYMHISHICNLCSHVGIL